MSRFLTIYGLEKAQSRWTVKPYKLSVYLRYCRKNGKPPSRFFSEKNARRSAEMLNKLLEENTQWQ